MNLGSKFLKKLLERFKVFTATFIALDTLYSTKSEFTTPDRFENNLTCQSYR